MEESALMVRGLCRQQGKFELRDISFTLPRGYIMGLVGRMGSGKTTLLKSNIESITDRERKRGVRGSGRLYNGGCTIFCGGNPQRKYGRL